ncbi:MAG TPA: hypothetical protein V6C76_05655 [Drouetiella sp.]
MTSTDEDDFVRYFPELAYLIFEQQFSRFINSPQNTNATSFDVDKKITLAWESLRLRYRTADAASLKFKSLWIEHGNEAKDFNLYLQEREFYSFLCNTLACVETGCYALYVLASKFDKKLLGNKPTSNLRQISIVNCKKRLAIVGTPAHLEKYFAKLLMDETFKELSELREISSHRVVMSRAANGGADAPNKTELDLPDTRIPLDEEFTEVRQLWLSRVVFAIIGQADLILGAAGVPY